jgi:PPOX class probable F420-dependent enzyme
MCVTTPLDVLGRADYVLLTTFRKDGTPVPTPVWVVRMGDELRVWSNPTAGKIKRIRRDGAVQIAPCTMRGKARGRSIGAVARLLPDADTAPVLNALVRKYGARAFFSTLGQRYFGAPTAAIGIVVPVDARPE